MHPIPPIPHAQQCNLSLGSRMSHPSDRGYLSLTFNAVFTLFVGLWILTAGCLWWSGMEVTTGSHCLASACHMHCFLTANDVVVAHLEGTIVSHYSLVLPQAITFRMQITCGGLMQRESVNHCPVAACIAFWLQTTCGGLMWRVQLSVCVFCYQKHCFWLQTSCGGLIVEGTTAFHCLVFSCPETFCFG